LGKAVKHTSREREKGKETLKEKYVCRSVREHYPW
jgi:hypothetical protein